MPIQTVIRLYYTDQCYINKTPKHNIITQTTLHYSPGSPDFRPKDLRYVFGGTLNLAQFNSILGETVQSLRCQ